MGLVIHAPNVHMGGGLILLTAILESLDENFQGCLVLDERLDIPEKLPESIVIHSIRPTPLGRLVGEWHLRKWVSANDVALCFGNVPPLFRLKGKVVVFLQNRYYLDLKNLRGFSLFSQLKMIFERFWFVWGKKRVRQFIVQTPSMQRAIQEHLGKPSMVFPFFKDPKGYKRSGAHYRVNENIMYDFVYVASGEPHKNHHRLIEAWILLAEEGLRPSICLTVPEERSPDLCAWIDAMSDLHNLRITNVGTISYTEISLLYQKTRAFIYPSISESMGLPLIEARCANLPILAPELDYVRDVIDPEYTFDPNSAVSIARAVKRFMGIPDPPLPLMDAKEYLKKVYDIEFA